MEEKIGRIFWDVMKYGATDFIKYLNKKAD